MKRNVDTPLPPFEFYCQAPPGSTGWCANKVESHKEALTRLNEVKDMSSSEIKRVLHQRQVPMNDSEDKASLVRKMIVTDQKKGKRTANIVTHTDKSGVQNHVKVCSREAPGAALINRKCGHGSSSPTMIRDSPAYIQKCKVLNKLISSFASQVDPSQIGIQQAIFGFWLENQQILKTDIEERFLPKTLWSRAVSAVIAEDGSREYAIMYVFCSLTTDRIIETLATSNKSRLTAADAALVLLQPAYHEAVVTIIAGESQLYMFMNRPDRRPCECMEYVATAAEIGFLRSKPMKVKTDIEHCAECNAALARPMICSLCKEVAYCGAMHQKQHWKVHKKECTGRQKT